LLSIEANLTHNIAGLSRLELRAKGDTNELYANLVVVILALGALWLPLMHYLVDRKGYAITLFVINTLGVVCSGLQARFGLCHIKVMVQSTIVHRNPAMRLQCESTT